MLSFSDIKQHVTIEQVASMLNLKLRKTGDTYRCACPACQSKTDRAIVITPARNIFYCFDAKKGGDVLTLASHVLGVGLRDAAQAISDHFLLASKESEPREPSAVPNGEASKEKATPTAQNVPTSPLQPLTYLVAEHEAVQALGLDAETAKALGLGFAPKGIMRGTVAFPLYRAGELAGYVGVPVGTSVSLPKNLRAH
jgi:DNA primase